MVVPVTERVVDLRVPLEGTLRTAEISRDDGTLAEGEQGTDGWNSGSGFKDLRISGFEDCQALANLSSNPHITESLKSPILKILCRSSKSLKSCRFLDHREIPNPDVLRYHASMETVTLTIDNRQVTVEKARPCCRPPSRAASRFPTTATTRASASTAPAASASSRSRRCRSCRRRARRSAPTAWSCRRRPPEVVAARARRVRVPARSTIRSTAPVCDKGGECPLQDFSYTFGPDQSRMEFPRRVFDGEGVKGDVDFGPTLMLNRQRCILCTRCVRFMRDVDGDAQINIIDRGYGSEIATFQEEGVHSLISGNLMDVCPVGAITTRDYRFKARPWDNPQRRRHDLHVLLEGLQHHGVAQGEAGVGEGLAARSASRRASIPDVNGYWMCDIGRFGYHWIEGDDRLRRPLMRGADGRAACRRRGTT